MLKKLLLLLFSIVFGYSLQAQCLEVLDGNGVFDDNPEFVSCTPGTYTVFIQPDRNMGNYTIDWGDGSANTTGAALLTGTTVSHIYASATATYTITITDNSTGCTITGLVVLERNPLASIQLPSGDDNFGCTPVQFRFINSSTQISPNTVFVWDFGDGSPTETYDATNLGAIVTHTYLPGVGVQSCELNVTLTATNFCGSSTASFFPLQVWDLDEAQITPSATLLCYPDTIVQYTNTTIRNCFPEGNNSQRFERWNFGDYWGLGRDSIIEWRAWNPPIINPPPIGYPGVGTYTVRLQDSSFCGIDDVTLAIQITNGPTAVITANKDTICEGESVTFVNGSFGGQNRYRWNYDLGSGFQNQSGNNKTRTYNTTGDYTIALIVDINGAQGCSDTADVDLHVLPSPTADFTFDTNNECDSMDVVFTSTSIGSISTFNWNFGNGNTFNGAVPPTEFYATPGVYNVILTVANTRGCSDTETKQITVRETPVANFSVNSVCLNTPAVFTDLSTSGGDPITSYNWAFGDGATSTQQNPVHLYTAFGTYTVRQIVSNGFCNDTLEIQVTVENRPTASFVASPKNGCSQLTVNFTNQSSANAISFLWNFGDGTSSVFARDTSHSYLNTGDFDTTFVVEMIAYTAFGCTDTIKDTITVNPVPRPSFTSDAVVDCGPVTVNFTNTTVGDSLNYFWNFGDGTAVVNDTNPTHVFENKTLFINNYQVRLVVESQNGCRDTITNMVQIFPEPIFTFVTMPDSGCSPLNVTFPSVVGAVDYQWDFGDGATASGPTPNHTYINNTTNNQTYSIRLIAQSSFGCLDTTMGTVLVFPNPTSNFSLDTNVGCQPLPITITNNSTGSNQFSWDFGDGTTSTNGNANFVKTFTNTAAVTQFNDIRLITETANGCRDTFERSVEVHPFIQAGFTSNDTGCSPLTVAFVNQSFGAQSFMWVFGDGGTDPTVSPSHVYTNLTNSNQTYLAELIAISAKGCLDTADRNILVYPKPQANYTADVTSGCQPLEVNFTQSSTLADNCFLNYGDLDTFKLCGPTSTHTYTNTGSFFPITYNSELTVTTINGCSSVTNIPITVNPQVIADFSSIDSGCSPLNVSFLNQSTGAQNFTWNYGDGANSFNQSPSHTYINSTTQNQVYNLQMIAFSQYNCSDTITKPITVFGKPNALITPDVTSGCQPLAVNFTNGSQGQDSCVWDFGDGFGFTDSCGVVVAHTFNNLLSTAPISRQSFLYVYTNEGCSDTANRIITVNPQIIANFSSIDSGCSPLNVSFLNQSVGAQSFIWNYGDGANSFTQSPSHTYTNSTTQNQVYNLELIALSQFSCNDTITKSITVFGKPNALITPDVTSGCQPLAVNFTNGSQGQDSCVWDFGDGFGFTDSCGVVVGHTFSNLLSSIPISRQSVLYVYTDGGCSDTANRIITVNPQIIADFSSIDSGCSPLNVSFLNQSVGAQNFIWNYGDGANSFTQSPNHTYTNSTTQNQVYNLELIALSQFSCNDTITKSITVFGKPNALITPDVTSGCQPLAVNFTNGSQGQDSCVWDFGDGFGFTDSCGVVVGHTFSNLLSSIPISRQSVLYVYTDEGCSDTANQVITVNPNVEAAFDSPTEGCSPFEVNFTNQSIGAPVFNWTFGDGATSSVATPKHTFFYNGQSDTTFITNLRASNNFGCFEDSQVTITVNPKPIADYTINTNESCQPVDITFTNNSSLRDSCSWIYGDGTFDLNNCTPITTHTYINTQSLVPIDYLSELRIFTNKGCSDTLTRNIRVRPQVVANFTGDTIACAPFNTTFRSQSFGAVNYAWNFGDGSTGSGAVVNHEFTNTGAVDSLYTVTLTASSLFNCDDVFTRTIIVHPTPLVGFTATPLTQEFPNATVNVTNTTNNGNWSYEWNFGDSNTSTVANPGSHTYATWGTYDIQLKATSANCSDSTIITVVIEAPTPIADFGDPVEGCEPLEVTFTNKSLYGQSYEWDFGDGGRSNSENPTHIYFNEGEYTVTLKVTGFPPGKTDQITKVNYIKVNKEPTADFITNTSEVFIPNDPVVFSNRSQNADSYRWEFGDGNSSDEQSPTYFYTEEGEFLVLLIAYTDEGCVDSTYAPSVVIAELEGKLQVPNAFTPNPNGSNGGVVNINPGAGNFNDVFYAKVNGTTKYELNIFNKWGELLFVSKDIHIGWDGYYRGKLAPQDAYVWKVIVEFADGTRQVRVGDLMLLR